MCIRVCRVELQGGSCVYVYAVCAMLFQHAFLPSSLSCLLFWFSLSYFLFLNAPLFPLLLFLAFFTTPHRSYPSSSPCAHDHPFFLRPWVRLSSSSSSSSVVVVVFTIALKVRSSASRSFYSSFLTRSRDETSEAACCVNNYVSTVTSLSQSDRIRRR